MWHLRTPTHREPANTVTWGSPTTSKISLELITYLLTTSLRIRFWLLHQTVMPRLRPSLSLNADPPALLYCGWRLRNMQPTYLGLCEHWTYSKSADLNSCLPKNSHRCAPESPQKDSLFREMIHAPATNKAYDGLNNDSFTFHKNDSTSDVVTKVLGLFIKSEFFFLLF